MTNKNRTKRAMLFSVLALVLCMSMFVGTTYAWFTDSVTSAKNQIVAGNLDVALKYQNKAVTSWTDVEGMSNIFDPNALWEPGHAEVAYFEVSNVGSLAMKYLFALNVHGETEGVNVAGEEFKLSDYLYYGLVEGAKPGDYATREAAIAAVANPKKLSESIDPNGTNHFANMDGEMAKGAAAGYVAIVIWMPTTVGNEANYRGVAPYIDLGVSVIATQWTAESDSFDNQYDAGAFDAVVEGFGTGSGTADANGDIVVEIRSNQGGKLGVAYTDESATDDGKLEITIEKLSEATLEHADGNIVVADDQTAVSYEITATGLKAGNTEKITVYLRVGNTADVVALYHNGVEIPQFSIHDDYIVFETTSFSPFTVIYGDKKVVDNGKPTAQVTPIATPDPLAGWGSYNGLGPNYAVDLLPALEVAYQFDLTETYDDVINGKYANWYCDFYVSLDRDLGENEIFLAGSYESFENGKWIGFHNYDRVYEAGTKVGLLKTFIGTEEEISNPTSGWTYSDVALLVNSFKCGVGDVGTALDGATITVELRLYDPTNYDNTVVAAVVTHTFATAE